MLMPCAACGTIHYTTMPCPPIGGTSSATPSWGMTTAARPQRTPCPRCGREVLPTEHLTLFYDETPYFHGCALCLRDLVRGSDSMPTRATLLQRLERAYHALTQPMRVAERTAIVDGIELDLRAANVFEQEVTR